MPENIIKGYEGSIEALWSFIKVHKTDDTTSLALKAHKYPGVPMGFVLDQIQVQNKLKKKIPSWHGKDFLFFESKLAYEQASSEATAKYKAGLFSGLHRVADLTGGSGVDSYFLSNVVEEVFFVERNDYRCKIARHNFQQLEALNIRVLNADAESYLKTQPDVEGFFIDPARRSEAGARVSNFDQCTPDVLELQTAMTEQSSLTIIKASPLIDISYIQDKIGCLAEIHILAVNGECKEVLALLKKENKHTLIVKAVNLDNNGAVISNFSFDPVAEKNIDPVYSLPEKYLYEPSADILKSGGFKSYGSRYGLNKLHRHSHLYTSDVYGNDIPGKAFEILDVVPFNKKGINKVKTGYGKINVSTRNFPLTAPQLEKKLQAIPGNDLHCFGSTLLDDQRVLIISKKL